MDVADDVDGPLDPRIQVELENLNSATDDINKLEIELDEATTAFKQLHSESTSQLKEIMNKIGPSCIEKARCYYEAMEVARQAQVQCQHQADLYRRASEIHAAAKETVALAEARFISNRHEWNFDQAWQDMLNHATIKVTDAENQKAECGREHHRRALLFHEAEKKAQQLEEKHRRAIIKARPYFEVRADWQQKMATLKERIQCRQKAVKEAKRAYAKSFRALEEISNQIHESRRDYDMMVNGPREPGVGAELISPEGSLNYDVDLDKVGVSRINSITSSESDIEDRDQDLKDVLELGRRVENLAGRSVDGSESTSSQWELELQASMEKLNTLSLKKPNWEMKNNNIHAENNEIKGQIDEKLPLDFRTDKTIISNITTGNSNTGWSSLTQSPINSILNRSKLAIKNSLSKSLSGSPVNIGLNFGKNKSNDGDKKPEMDLCSNSIDNSYDSTVNCSINNNNQCVPTEIRNFSSEKTTNSINKNCKLDFVEAPIFKKSTCKISSVKELPLLSMFEKSNDIQMSKDRSCSMINLAEKRNLKSLLDNSQLGNIQAVSVERLANARHILMAEYTDSKTELSKKN